MKRDDKAFEAYREQLMRFPHYTQLTEADKQLAIEIVLPPEKFTMAHARAHPAKWLYYICGVKPMQYQVKMLNEMMTQQKFAGVTSRQIGKSVMTAGFAFWAVYNNIYPAGMDKKTTVVIVSHTEDASKKLLQEVLSYVKMADNMMAKYTRASVANEVNYFTDRMTAKPTQYKLEFNGGKIIVLPPTDKVRGNSASVLIIDEADFLKHDDPDHFFNSIALPTTTATNGKVILWSTPKGTESYFKRIIRPDSPEPAQGWHRIWFPWTIVNPDEQLPNYYDNTWSKRLEYIERGDELDFKIEFEASFLSGKHTFFNPEIIDKCVVEHLNEQWSSDAPVTVGIDYGDVHSRTVVTVVSHDNNKNTTTLLSIKEFPAKFNNADIVAYMDTIKNRYRVQRIITDDCPAGTIADELLRRKGYNIEGFVFRKSKNEYYEYLKNAFANNRIELYNEMNLITQLKSIESHETVGGNVQIKKPAGARDDMADSFMLACSPHIQPVQTFERFIA